MRRPENRPIHDAMPKDIERPAISGREDADAIHALKMFNRRTGFWYKSTLPDVEARLSFPERAIFQKEGKPRGSC
ncbi:hypothetical protein [Brucella melitensis]|uniref:hypothetical protein n=1 Tax=Brucella melitensis TaxID=29459 RepID=UPI0032B75F96